jgi:lysine-N-methylase
MKKEACTMKDHKKITLVPQYLQKFSCIGSECEDTCCVGWRVDIDKRTYLKYKQVKNASLKKLLNENIKRTRKNATEKNYAHIKLDNNHSCPMLTKDNLCHIQLELGEEYLSNVCSSYPRVANIVNGTIEKSATLSCPEAARLALLNPNKMEFDEIVEEADKKMALHGVLQVGNEAYNLSTYFWNLRIFSISLIQQRRYCLADRLILLGIFLTDVDRLVEKQQHTAIPTLVSNYHTLIEQGSLLDSLNQIPIEPALQIKLLKKIIDIRLLLGLDHKRYLQCHSDFLSGIGFSDDATLEEIANRYQSAYHNYYKPFMDQHEYILENYLVNYIFKNLFPLGSNERCMEDYVKLILHYGIIKMHLIGMAGHYRDSFNESHVITCIQSIARVVEHNSEYLKYCLELLKTLDVKSLAGMAIFIKN